MPVQRQGLFRHFVCREKHCRWSPVINSRPTFNAALTSWRAAHNNTPNAIVDPFEATSPDESLGRLQPRLDGIDREEEQVHSCTRCTSCLSGIRNVANVHADRKGTERRTMRDWAKVGLRSDSISPDSERNSVSGTEN